MLYPCGRCFLGSTQSSFWVAAELLRAGLGTAPSAPLGSKEAQLSFGTKPLEDGELMKNWWRGAGSQEQNTTAEKHPNIFK